MSGNRRGRGHAVRKSRRIDRHADRGDLSAIRIGGYLLKHRTVGIENRDMGQVVLVGERQIVSIGARISIDDHTADEGTAGADKVCTTVKCSVRSSYDSQIPTGLDCKTTPLGPMSDGGNASTTFPLALNQAGAGNDGFSGSAGLAITSHMLVSG